MPRLRRPHLTAALVGITVLVTGSLSAQESRVRERADRVRDRELGELIRQQVDDAMRRSADAMRHSADAIRRSEDAMRRVEEQRFRVRDYAELSAETQERVREALDRAQLHNFNFNFNVDVDRHREMADEIRNRVNERVLDRDQLWHLDDLRFRLDGLRLQLDGQRWDMIDGARLGEEIRARVRDDVMRSEAVRERALERVREALRQSELRVRDRDWR